MGFVLILCVETFREGDVDAPQGRHIFKYGVTCQFFRQLLALSDGKNHIHWQCVCVMRIRSSLILENGTGMEASSSGSLFQAGIWGLSGRFQLFLNTMSGTVAF